MWKGILYKLPWIRSSFFLVIILLYHPPTLLFERPLPLLGHNFMCYIHFNSQVVSFTLCATWKTMSMHHRLLLRTWSLCPRRGHGDSSLLVAFYNVSWPRPFVSARSLGCTRKLPPPLPQNAFSGMSSMSLTSTRTQSICVPYPAAAILAEGEWGISNHPLTKSEWIKRKSRARYLQNNRRKKLLADWLIEQATTRISCQPTSQPGNRLNGHIRAGEMKKKSDLIFPNPIPIDRVQIEEHCLLWWCW